MTSILWQHGTSTGTWNLVSGTGIWYHTLNSQQLSSRYQVPGPQEYPLLDIRSESIIYVGLQRYKIQRTFYTFLWWKSSTFFRKAGAEKMNHGGSKQKPLLTELAVRKNVDEIPHRFTYRKLYMFNIFLYFRYPWYLVLYQGTRWSI